MGILYKFPTSPWTMPIKDHGEHDDGSRRSWTDTLTPSTHHITAPPSQKGHRCFVGPSY